MFENKATLVPEYARAREPPERRAGLRRSIKRPNCGYSSAEWCQSAGFNSLARRLIRSPEHGHYSRVPHACGTIGATAPEGTFSAPGRHRVVRPPAKDVPGLTEGILLWWIGSL